MKHLFFVAILLWALTGPAMAHVTTLATPEEQAMHGGTDWAFFLSPLSSAEDLTWILLTILGIGILYLIVVQLEGVRTWLHGIRSRLDGHREEIPIILRLLLGLSLLGSAVEHHLFLPSVPGLGLEFVEVIIALSLLLGFLTRLSALVVIGLFLWGSAHSAYLWGSLEIPAVAALLVFFGPGKRSADEVLGIERTHWLTVGQVYLLRFSAPTLRFALGITFVWLAISEKFLSPHVAGLIIQRYGLTSAIPVSEAMWVFASGWIELAVGLALLLGVVTRSTAAIACVVLIASFLYFFTQGAAPFHHVTLFGALSILLISGRGSLSAVGLIQSKLQCALRSLHLGKSAQIAADNTPGG